MNHRRYYQIAGITIQVESDLPITDTTFRPKFKIFEVDGPGEDTIIIRHHFYLPDLKDQDLGKEVYRRSPWTIYKKANSCTYVCAIAPSALKDCYQLAIFNHDYTRAKIHNPSAQVFLKGSRSSLTLSPTDQILLAQILADRQGGFLHSSGVILDSNGLLFVGHSEAGKSTMVKMLKDRAKILCDDRIIVRRWPEGLKIHGTWSHGEIPDVSASEAPLKGIFFLEKAKENRLTTLQDKGEIIRRVLDCLIKPFATKDWWEKMISLAETIAGEAPCYNLQFDKSSKVVEILQQTFVKEKNN